MAQQREQGHSGASTTFILLGTICSISLQLVDVQLFQTHDGLQFLLPLSIGTPPQTIMVAIDTSSAEMVSVEDMRSPLNRAIFYVLLRLAARFLFPEND